MVRTGTALGVIPVGTNNSWALQMGIPALNPWSPGTNVVKLVAEYDEKRIINQPAANYYGKVIMDSAQVLVNGHTVAVDMGEISGSYFLLWAGIGLDAEILQSISPAEKKDVGVMGLLIDDNRKLAGSSSTGRPISLDGKPSTSARRK